MLGLGFRGIWSSVLESCREQGVRFRGLRLRRSHSDNPGRVWGSGRVCALESQVRSLVRYMVELSAARVWGLGV